MSTENFLEFRSRIEFNHMQIDPERITVRTEASSGNPHVFFYWVDLTGERVAWIKDDSTLIIKSVEDWQKPDGGKEDG